MSLPASDALTHAGAVSIATYSANWTTFINGASINVDANGAFGTGAAVYQPALWNADAFPNDQFSQMTFVTGASTTPFFGPAVRMSTPTGGSFYWFSVGSNGGNYALQRMVNGTEVDIIARVNHTFNNNDVLLIQVNGTVISLFQNGTLLANVSDTKLASGSAGFVCFQTSGANTPATKTWSGGAAAVLASNWNTKTGIDLRNTLAYVTDPAGSVWGGNGPALDLTIYGSVSSSLSVNNNAFQAGWVITATGVPINTTDGARDKSNTVDARLAGRQGAISGSTNISYKIQAGSAVGRYRMWLAFTDQAVSVSPDHTSIAVRDSNGTLFTVTLPATITTPNVVGADNTVYSTAAAWAAAADGSGIGVNFVTTDNTNGNGGPFIFIDDGGSGNQGGPLAHVALQFQGSAAPPFYYRKNVLYFV